MENKEIKEAIVEEVKKEKKNNSFKEFLKSKIFYSICSFIIGLLVMFIIIKLFIPDTLVKKITNENIVSNTLEETSDLKNGINNIYESTVYIEVSSRRGSSSSGSGFIYKKDNDFAYILTNYHVIEDADKFLVTLTSGNELEATLVSGDEYYDIAVLKVKASEDLKVAEMADSSSIEIGDTVFTVGAPLGKEYMGTITKGIVSGVNRMVSVTLSSGSFLMEVIQTDASINSGNSGGPICNIKGQVIGITSSKLVGSGIEGMGFAIPINSVMDIIENIETGSKIIRPYLGIQLSDLNNTFALQYYYNIKISSDVTFGAVLSYVEEGKPADKAGLKAGDVIVELDGKKVEDVSYFKYLLYKHKIGDKINIKYYRENKLSETTIELTETIKS